MAGSFELGRAFVAIQAALAPLRNDLDTAERETDKSAAKMESRFSKMGKAMTVAISAPLAAVAGLSIKAALDIDDAMDTIRATTGKTGKVLQGLQSDFKAVFRNVPQDAGIVAEALSDIHKRTGQTGTGLQELTKQILDMSRLTKTDVGANVAAATRLFGDWSIATDKQGQALDHVFKVSQQTGIGVDQLMQKVVQFGAPLRQFNFTFEESTALMGKWEKEGVNAELVLGSLRIAMAQFAKEGIPLKEGLMAVRNEIVRLGPGAEATALSMKTFGARAGPDMAAAILEGRFAVDDLMKSIAGSKETIASATEDTDGFAEGWTKAKHEITLALEPLGVSLLGVLNDLKPVMLTVIGYVKGLADWFQNLTPEAQKMWLAIGGIVAIAGPVISALTSIMSTVKTVHAGMVALNAFSFSPLLLGLSLVAAAFLTVKAQQDKFFEQQDKLRQQQALEETLAQAGMKTRQKVGESYDQYIERMRKTAEMLKLVAKEQQPVTDLQIKLGDVTDQATAATVKKMVADAEILAKLNKNEEATRKLNEQIEKERDLLREQGAITLPAATKRFEELTAAFNRGKADKLDDVKIITALYPLYAQLAAEVKKSGFEIKELTAAVQLQHKVIKATIPSFTLPMKDTTAELLKATGAGKQLTGAMADTYKQAILTEGAFKAFGLETPKALKAAAVQARQNFEDLKNSGVATAQQLADAMQKVYDAEAAAAGNSREALKAQAAAARAHYEDLKATGTATYDELRTARLQMLEAEAKAAGRTVDIWQTEIVPGIKQALVGIRSEAAHTLAEIMAGTISFKDGFLGVWQSLKNKLINILGDILDAFLKDLIGGMLRGMRGAQGSLGGAFAGVFSSFGGGGGSSAGVTGGSIFADGSGGGLVGNQGKGIFGMSQGQMAGAALAISGGLSLINAIKQGNKKGGALSGLTTGAGIGMMAGGPIGAAVGAGIGAISGAIAAAFGGRKGVKANDARDALVGQIEQTYGTGSFSGYQGGMGKLGEILAGEGRTDLFKQLIAANSKEQVESVAKAIDEVLRKFDATKAAVADLSLTWKDLNDEARKKHVQGALDQMSKTAKQAEKDGYKHEAILRSQSGAYSELAQVAAETGMELPASVRGVFDELIALGLLLDATGEKFTDLSKIKFADAISAEFGKIRTDFGDQRIQPVDYSEFDLSGPPRWLMNDPELAASEGSEMNVNNYAEFNINAADALSFARMLAAGGGEEILSWFERSDAGGAPEGPRARFVRLAQGA